VICQVSHYTTNLTWKKLPEEINRYIIIHNITSRRYRVNELFKYLDRVLINLWITFLITFTVNQIHMR